MFPIDPRGWLASEEVQPFVFTRSKDLAAVDGTLKTVAEGKYLIMSERPARGQVLVVKAVVPWAMYRKNVGVQDQECVQFCDPSDVNGQVLFEVLVGGNSPVLFDVNVPAFKTDANASNKDAAGGKGIPFISADPWKDAQMAWNNPQFTFLVKSGAELQVAFSILRPSVVNPIPAVYTVPPTANAVRRIDFAGVTLVGLSMSEQTYAKIDSAVSGEKRA